MSEVFQEKELNNLDGFNRFEFKNLTKDESIIVYLADVADMDSADFGEFKLFKMLKLNVGKTIDEMLDGAELISSIPNTMLLNMVSEGLIAEGNMYRITKAWDRGDKFSGGKIAKGYGYKVYALSNPQLMPKVVAKYKELLSGPTDTEGEEITGSKTKKPTL